MSHYASGNVKATTSGHSPLSARVASPVDQRGLRGAQVPLKGNQSCVVRIRAAQVKFLKTKLLGSLDGFPKQQRHAPEAVKPRVGAAVLVDKRAAVLQRQNAGNCLLILEDDVNRDLVAQAGNQIPEPLQRLRRQFMATASQAAQAIELTEKYWGSARLVMKAFAFRALDLSLCRVLLESTKEVHKRRTDIESVETVRTALMHI